MRCDCCSGSPTTSEGLREPAPSELIAQEPAATGDARFDAALAGVAEFFATERGIPAPGWVNQTGPLRRAVVVRFQAGLSSMPIRWLTHQPLSPDTEC